MGNMLAGYGHGDQRNIWVVTDGKLEEMTPIEDTVRAACQLTISVGARFYLKRWVREKGVAWQACDAYKPTAESRMFPSEDAAVMYAAIAGGVR